MSLWLRRTRCTVKDLLLYVPRTQIGVKESFIIHLISEVKIDHPEKGVNEEEQEEIKGIGKGKKKARTILISNPVSNPK
jgi:hypothetical protein